MNPSLRTYASSPHLPSHQPVHAGFLRSSLVQGWALWYLHAVVWTDREIEDLKELATLANRLPLHIAQTDLESFRTLIIPRAEQIRWRMLGVVVDRVRRLSAGQRACLHVLDVDPDLLSPAGQERFEPVHTRILSYFLGTDSGDIGDDAWLAFADLIGLEVEDETRSLRLVQAEKVLGARGRVDLAIQVPGRTVLVEVKIDSYERAGQVAEYAEGLSSSDVMVWLTADPYQKAECEGHVHITFQQLLASWLPIAAARQDGHGRYLSAYLKTLARHQLGLAEGGDFDSWSLGQQHRTLNFIEREVFL